MSLDKSILLWDSRFINRPIIQINGHQDEIYNVQWSTLNPNLLCTSGKERYVYIWDISKVNQNQEVEDIDDGLSELLMKHGGHDTSISDIGWNPEV